MGCLVQKNRVDIFCRLSTMHEPIKQIQTDRPRNGNNRRNRLSTMSPNNNTAAYRPIICCPVQPIDADIPLVYWNTVLILTSSLLWQEH